MAKKRISKIQSETDEPRMLAGLVCHESDYRISWEINNILNIQLTREENIALESKNGKDNFVLYQYFDEEKDIRLFLFANKGEKGYMAEGYKKIDYFFMICGKTESGYSEKIISNLKNSQLIQGVFALPANIIKPSTLPY